MNLLPSHFIEIIRLLKYMKSVLQTNRWNSYVAQNGYLFPELEYFKYTIIYPILFFVSLIQILFDVTVKMLKVFLTWFGQGLKENMFLESGMNRFKVNFLQCIYTQFVKSICHEMKSCAQICSRQKRSVSLVVHLNM